MNNNYMLYPGRKRDEINFEESAKQKPEITIITAYYNGDKYIDDTVNSVLNQTFPAWEWIIVDDGSTEEKSIKKLKEIAQIDKRIKIAHKENSGVSETRDYGAKLADKNSKYILFLDDDDVINKTYLECAYWTLQTNRDATWAYTDLLNFQGQEYKWVKYFDIEKEKQENLLVITALIRKEAFWEVNGFEIKDKSVYEDWNLWLKLLAKGKKPVRMNFDGFWYRRKETNSELQRSKENHERAMEIIKETSKKISEDIEAIQYPKQEYNWESIVEEIPWNRKYQIKEDGKINILMIIPWMITGGADKFNLDLITRIDKSKYNIIVINTNPKINTWRQDFEEQTLVYDLTTFIDQRYWVAFINNLIEQYRIKIILNTNSYVGYSMIPYLKSRYPEIPIMDYIHMEEWYNRCGGYSRDSSLVEPCIDKTLVCNENSRKILIDYFHRDEKDIKTVYIGVDEKIYNPDKYNKEEILKKYDLEGQDDKYIISYICRIDLQKRPMLLAEILKKLKEKREDFLCIIAGDGPMLEMLHSKLKKYNLLKNVKLVGNVKETANIYKISDLTINCSIKEGLALTAYESLSMGVPVVSSDVGGQAELINDEVGAVVSCLQKEEDISKFDYQDEEINSYVEKIDDILNNLDRYKKNCRKRILKGFTIDQMVVNMEKEFEEVYKNPKIQKIEIGRSLQKVQCICKELITKSFITIAGEYRWLCEQVNLEYFGTVNNSSYDKYGGYDYFKTPAGRFRLLMIAITKKLHIYIPTRNLLRKLRKDQKEIK